MTIWLTILGMGLVTFAIRFGPIALLERWPLSAPLQRALRFVPASVLAAIIAEEMVLVNGQLLLGPANPRFIAGLVAGVVAYRTHNVLWTLALGMVTLWLVELVF